VVTSGPYRLLQHPGYAGGMLAIVGLGLMWGNWVSMATLTLLWLALVIWRIRFEEAALRLAIITWLSFTPHDCPQPVGNLAKGAVCTARQFLGPVETPVRGGMVTGAVKAGQAVRRGSGTSGPGRITRMPAGLP
jgi:hypothetical protein